MLNISFVSLYGNVGLILKCLEDATTKAIENWPLLTILLSVDDSSRDNPSEYPHKPHIDRN